MEINKETIDQITTDVCDSMLGLTLVPSRVEQQPSENVIVGTVRIAGDREAEVEVFASEDLGQKIGVAMFQMSEDELADDDVLDAIGEVANMIGGNVKGCYDSDCQLSIPEVERRPAAAVNDETSGHLDASFTFEGHPLVVRVRELAAGC